jgi:hypothetical protein
MLSVKHVFPLQQTCPGSHWVVPHGVPHWPLRQRPPQHAVHAPLRGQVLGQVPVALQQRWLRQTQPAPFFVQSTQARPSRPQFVSM